MVLRRIRCPARRWATLAAGLLASVLACVPAGAEQAPVSYDQVSLTVQSEAEIDNDTLTAVLFAQREGKDVASMSDEVNRAVEWALTRARLVQEVRVQTLQYQTQPIYGRDGPRGWRVRQSFRLRSENPAVLSELIGELQARVAVQSIQYDVLPATRTRAQDRLIGEALAEFTRRAELIAKHLDRPGYRLIRIDVGTGIRGPAPVARMATTMAAEARAAPALDPGTRRLSVSVTGAIELRPGR